MGDCMDQIICEHVGFSRKLEEYRDLWKEYVQSFANYQPLVTNNGKSFLPPVMNGEKRHEMQMYRRQAGIAAARLKCQLRERVMSAARQTVAHQHSADVARASTLISKTELWHSLEEPQWVPSSSGGRRSGNIFLAEPLLIDESCVADEPWQAEPERLLEAGRDGSASASLSYNSKEHHAPGFDSHDPGVGFDACQIVPFGESWPREATPTSCDCGRKSDKSEVCKQCRYSSVKVKLFDFTFPPAPLLDLAGDSQDSDSETTVSEAYCSLPPRRAMSLSPVGRNLLNSDNKMSANELRCDLPCAEVDMPSTPEQPRSTASAASPMQSPSKEVAMSPLIRSNSYTLLHPSPALLRSRLAMRRSDPEDGRSLADKISPERLAAASLHDISAGRLCEVVCAGEKNQEGTDAIGKGNECNRDARACWRRDLTLLKAKHSKRLLSASGDSAAIFLSSGQTSGADSGQLHKTPFVATETLPATDAHFLGAAYGCFKIDAVCSCLDKLAAHVRGYLTRRLLSTSKVTLLRKTIKDCLHLQATEPSSTFASPDMGFRKRLEMELAAARRRVHDIFFAASAAEERASLLRHSAAATRHQSDRQLHMPSHAVSSWKDGKQRAQTQVRGRVSAVTVKVIERKTQQVLRRRSRVNTGSQKSSNSKLSPPEHRLSNTTASFLVPRDD